MKASIINFLITCIIVYGAVRTMQDHKDKELALQKAKYEKALDIVIKKYKWKKNRLRVYTDLVYNTKYGVVYEK